MNNRRNLLIVLSAALFTPRAVFAQAKKPLVLIGWLSGGRGTSASPEHVAFKEGLAELGWKEGQQYVIEARWAEGRFEQLQPLAEELIAKRPTLIVTTSSRATLVAANSSRIVPIVQANGGSLVNLGLAKSLARPGGMVTGVTNLADELSIKYLELLLAAAPKLKRVGFLLDLATPSYAVSMKNARSAAEQYRVEARFADVAKAEEIETAVARLAKEGVEGLVSLPTAGLFSAERRRIITLALAHRWPMIGSSPLFVENGALLSYSADLVALQRRAAFHVDRILKGAKPGDLPIEGNYMVDKPMTGAATSVRQAGSEAATSYAASPSSSRVPPDPCGASPASGEQVPQGSSGAGQASASGSSGCPADDGEIVVTRGMEQAGEEIIDLYYGVVGSAYLARLIYIAMAAIEPNEDQSPPERHAVSSRERA